jgi:hypothetical protein
MNSYSKNNDDENKNDILSIRCPWGNVFHLYSLKQDDQYDLIQSNFDQSSKQQNNNNDNNNLQQQQYNQRKIVQLHQMGGQYGPHRMAVRGQPGIRYIELICPTGMSCHIAEFYTTILGCLVLQQTRSMTTNNDNYDDDNNPNSTPIIKYISTGCYATNERCTYLCLY